MLLCSRNQRSDTRHLASSEQVKNIRNDMMVMYMWCMMFLYSSTDGTDRLSAAQLRIILARHSRAYKVDRNDKQARRPLSMQTSPASLTIDFLGVLVIHIHVHEATCISIVSLMLATDVACGNNQAR